MGLYIHYINNNAYEIHLQTSKDGVFGTGATFNSNNCMHIIYLSMYV